MKYDIILAGVGGQGILSIATVLGRAALKAGCHLKQAEVHGMAQRGGAVQSHFRISSEPIHSDVIAHASANMILSMEPMEGLRYLSWLSPDGWLITNETPVENIPDYPALGDIKKEISLCTRSILFDGNAIAKEAGSARALNMAVLGAASGFIPLEENVIKEAIQDQFANKGDAVVKTNIDAFTAARDYAEKIRKEMEASGQA